MPDRASFREFSVVMLFLVAVVPPCPCPAEGAILLGHKRSVYGIALSPDGRLAATCGTDGTVRLWDATTGKQHCILLSCGEWVQSVAFSPDGKLLAASSDDQRVRLWDVTTRKERFVLSVGDAIPRRIAFSPDGRLLACACADRLVRLWEVASGKPMASLKTGESAWSVTFNHDGTLIAAGEWKGVVRVWETGSGKLVHEFKGHNSRVLCLVCSPDGRVLASAGEDERVRLWDIRTGKERAVARPHDDILDSRMVFSLAFLPDGRSLVSAGGGAIRVRDFATGTEWGKFPGHGRVTHAIAVSSDGRLLASAGADGEGGIGDLPTRPPDPEPDRLTATKLASLWDDLNGSNGAMIHNAVWTLARSPRDSIPFLREHLKPARNHDAARLAQLVANLDDDRFATRERATKELAAVGWAAGPHLRRALEGKPSEELRRRAESLLESLRREKGGGTELRNLFAMEALEHAGTVEAQALLRDLAGGAEGHPLTEDAKSSLQRLERRPKRKP